jgi:hypothetical protein
MKQKAPQKKQARKHDSEATNEWDFDLPSWEVDLPSWDIDLPKLDFDLPDIDLPQIETLSETKSRKIKKAMNQRNSKAKKHKKQK